MRGGAMRHIALIGVIFAAIALAEVDGSCCWKVAVERGSDTGKAYAVWADDGIHGKSTASIYQTYYLKPGSENGKPYYISEDNNYGIWYSGRAWYVGTKGILGQHKGYMENWGNVACPNSLGYAWKYWPSAQCGGVWTDAGKSFK